MGIRADMDDKIRHKPPDLVPAGLERQEGLWRIFLTGQTQAEKALVIQERNSYEEI